MARNSVLKKIRVLVVDDQELFAEGTAALLSYETDIEVVGVAKNRKECLTLVRKIKLDVVLLELNLPDVSGITLIDEIKLIQFDVKVIMLTGYNPKR